MTNAPRSPLDPQAAIDLVFTATAFSSSNVRMQSLGEVLFQEFFASLRDRYKNDAVASRYLDAVIPALGSALRAFAVEKQNYKRDILPFEELLNYEAVAIRQSQDLLPIEETGRSFSRWAGRLAKGAIAVGAGAGLVALTTPATRWAEASVLLTAGTVAGIAVDRFSRCYRKWRTEGLVNDTRALLDKRWKEMFGRYEAILLDYLLMVIRANEINYPETLTFHDGHLYPRGDLPVLPPPNAAELRPSPRPTLSIVSQLRTVVCARMSIEPAHNKLDWLNAKLVSNPNRNDSA